MIHAEPLVWIDLETGGVDPDLHQITQLAAIATTADPWEFEELGEPFERKVTLVDGRWTQEALNAQAYDPVVWAAEAVPILDALRAFEVWLGPHTHPRASKKGSIYRAAHMAGHNAASFDAAFLRKTAERLGLWLPITNWTGGVFDTLHLAKWAGLVRGEEHTSHTLEGLCAAYDLDVFGAHDALEDVRATVALARHLFPMLTNAQRRTP